MEEQTRIYGAESTFQELNADRAVASWTAGKQALQDFQALAKDWSDPIDMNCKVTELKAALKLYDERRFQLQNIQEFVGVIALNKKCFSEKAKRTWGENQKKHETFFIGQGVGIFAAVARTCSYRTYGDLAKSPVGLVSDVPPRIPEFLDDDGGHELWETPFLLSKPRQDLQVAQTWLHTGIQKFIEDRADEAAAFYPAQQLKLSKNPAQAGSIGEVKNVTPFPWNKDPDKKVVNPIADVPSLFFCGRDLMLELTAVGMPHRGLAHYFYVYKGLVCVVLLDREQVAEHPDLKSWLKDEDAKALFSNQAAIVREGEAVFVPSGFAPLCVGLPADRDFTPEIAKLSLRGRSRGKKKEPLSSAFLAGITLCFEQDTADFPAPLRRAILAGYNMGAQYFPKALKTLQSVKNWAKSLDKDD